MHFSVEILFVLIKFCICPHCNSSWRI